MLKKISDNSFELSDINREHMKIEKYTNDDNEIKLTFISGEDKMVIFIDEGEANKLIMGIKDVRGIGPLECGCQFPEGLPI